MYRDKPGCFTVRAVVILLDSVRTRAPLELGQHFNNYSVPMHGAVTVLQTEYQNVLSHVFRFAALSERTQPHNLKIIAVLDAEKLQHIVKTIVEKPHMHIPLHHIINKPFARTVYS